MRYLKINLCFIYNYHYSRFRTYTLPCRGGDMIYHFAYWSHLLFYSSFWIKPGKQRDDLNTSKTYAMAFSTQINVLANLGDYYLQS